MIADIAGRVRDFRQVNALVIGEAMLDSYVRGDANRLSREAPVPIVAVTGQDDAPGGAANTAVNLAALGARASLVSIVGDDDEGDRLRAALRRAGVDADGVIAEQGRMTLAKERILAGDQMVVRIDRGLTDPLDAAAEDRLIDALVAAHERADVVIVSDYDYGVVSTRLLAALRDLQARSPKPLVVDARDLRRYRRLDVTAVKPNYLEAIGLLGEPDQRGTKLRVGQIAGNGQRLLEATGARIVAVTIDAEGVIVFEEDAPPYRTYARPRTDAQAAGGGDTFIATLALALASGATTPEAAELASTAAAIVVGKPGTAICSSQDLIGALSLGGKRLDGPEELRRLADVYRTQGRRIVFTNGCFDILHRGHVTYLDRAKGLGDVLIVAVNSDASVRRLKGADRPINGLDDRLLVLEALSCVDNVVAFDTDTPEQLIEAVRPDVFAKGGDYSRESLPEAGLVERLGGSVQILPLVDDRSTTGIIRRARTAEPVATR
ncbi:MAG TPA: D-glycero-beta-D-manno-heptose 1-phosphate adenylyltransferase [Candidatus Limnocylindrales bacterium]|nr:D-glycero-beta-D-manno-heptose 1-phosphate adenylyltransferase [Candidatus Limnocylindrales bacterium]